MPSASASTAQREEFAFLTLRGSSGGCVNFGDEGNSSNDQPGDQNWDLAVGTPAPAGFIKIGTTKENIQDLTGHSKTIQFDVYKKN